MLTRSAKVLVRHTGKCFSTIPTLFPKKLTDILDIDKLTSEFPLTNNSDLEANLKSIKKMYYHTLHILVFINCVIYQCVMYIRVYDI